VVAVVAVVWAVWAAWISKIRPTLLVTKKPRYGGVFFTPEIRQRSSDEVVIRVQPAESHCHDSSRSSIVIRAARGSDPSTRCDDLPGMSESSGNQIRQNNLMRKLGSILFNQRLFASCLLLLCLAATAQTNDTNIGTKKLDIDRLYSLPWLIGTTPKDFVWAKDSQRVAYLWNDEGTNFYDVWITDVSSSKPVRVTRMPRTEMPSNPGTDVAKLEQVAAAETDAGVSAITWTTDSKQIVFTFKGELYKVIPGEKEMRITDTAGTKSQASVAPRGSRLAYLSAGDLWIASLAGSTAIASTQLTTVAKKDVDIVEFHWSNDGESLVFIESDDTHILLRGIPDYLSDESRIVTVKRAFPGEPSSYRRVGFVAVEGGAVRWADLGGSPMDQIFGLSWAPDNKTVLVDSSDLYVKDRRLLLLDPRSGKWSLLLEEKDPKNVSAEWWSTWAPDGRGIYFISDRDNDYHVYYKARSGGEPKRITRGDWAVFSASIASAADAIFVTTNEGKPEERQLFKVPLSGGKAQRLTTQAGTYSSEISPDGKFAADVFSNDATPPDFYLTRLDASPASEGSTRQITHSRLPEFGQYHWVSATYVTFKNVRDGTTLHGRLTLPPNFDPNKKYPAILGSVYSNTVRNQWGGRIAHPTWGLDQYLAQQGYVLLNVDISGSAGHGKIFRQRIGLDYGGVDVADLFSGVKFLEGQHYVDMQRLGMWGSSYGGLLTTTSLFTYPGVYKAGIAGAPATSLFHALTGEMQTMMAPQDHIEQYTRSSAFLKSGGLQDHLMLLHGMRDQIVLFKDSVTLTQRLILQGKDIRLTPLPNAPHGWDTEGMAQTRYAYHQMIDYFRQYLGQGPTP
jgi:dipeptidyl-peptidase-4